MNLEELKRSIRSVQDFPKSGVIFRDITTALKNPEVLQFIVDTLYERYKDKGITKVVGIESRGLILGSILAYKLNAGFVPLRKPSKLPAATFRQEYDLEYGTDALEIHQDALQANDVVLLHDDLLATGGSAYAALSLIQKFNVQSVYLSFLIELDFLQGRKKFQPTIDMYSLIHY